MRRIPLPIFVLLVAGLVLFAGAPALAEVCEAASSCAQCASRDDVVPGAKLTAAVPAVSPILTSVRVAEISETIAPASPVRTAPPTLRI